MTFALCHSEEVPELAILAWNFPRVRRNILVRGSTVNGTLNCGLGDWNITIYPVPPPEETLGWRIRWSWDRMDNSYVYIGSDPQKRQLQLHCMRSPILYLGRSVFLWSNVWGYQLWWFKEVYALPVSWRQEVGRWSERVRVRRRFWFKFLATWRATGWLPASWSLVFCTEVAGIWGGPNLLKCPQSGGKDLLFLNWVF